MNYMWVVYEWHSGQEMTEDDLGHFLSHQEAYKFMEKLWEYPFDAKYHIQKISIWDKVNCPRCGANINIMFYQQREH